MSVAKSLASSIARQVAQLVALADGGGADPLLSSIVAWWSADETRGTIDVAMLDHSGNNYHAGTSGNPAQGTAAIAGGGNSITFDGTDVASTPRDIGVDWAGDWSCSFWVRSESTDFGYIIGRWSSSSTNRSWSLLSTNGAALRFYSGGLAGNAATIIGSSPSLTVNTWHHLIIQHDSGANRVTIIKDGTPTLLAADANLASYDLPLTFGDAVLANAGINDGKICSLDEIAVWSRLLTDDEKSRLYNSGDGMSFPGTQYTIPTRAVYGIGGQSNADGRGTNLQSYTGTQGSKLLARITPYATREDFALSNITDPVGLGNASVQGSCWPLFANELAGACVLVSFAQGGSAITYWQKSGSLTCSRATPFGQLCYRMQIAACYGQVATVLWWQGEDDVAAGTAQATYQSLLETLANDLNADTGCVLKPCLLQAMETGAYTPANQAAIKAAIQAAITANANIVSGPDFSDLSSVTLGDGVHIQTDGGLQTVAERWAASI